MLPIVDRIAKLIFEGQFLLSLSHESGVVGTRARSALRQERADRSGGRRDGGDNLRGLQSEGRIVRVGNFRWVGTPCVREYINMYGEKL